MKIRIFDSDGEFRGGLFKTNKYNALKCRMWHAPPHPHYKESLIDISGLNNPCQEGSWFILRIAVHQEISDPGDGSDDYDDNSQALRIAPCEAKHWLERNGYMVRSDLTSLLNDPSHVAESEKVGDPFAPYMPAGWFRDEFGIPNERLRSSHRSGLLRRIKKGGRMMYSVPGAREIWPEDIESEPETPA